MQPISKFRPGFTATFDVENHATYAFKNRNFMGFRVEIISLWFDKS